MNYETLISEESKRPWVFLTPQLQKGDLALPEVCESIDLQWNFLLSRSILSGKLQMNWGEKTLLHSESPLGTRTTLVFGIGDGDSLTAKEARQLTQDLSRTLEGLGFSAPWILAPKSASKSFLEEFERSRTSSPTLKQAKIFLS